MKQRSGSNQYVRDGDVQPVRAGRVSQVDQRRSVEDRRDVDEVAWLFHPDRRVWQQAGWRDEQRPWEWEAAGWSAHQAKTWIGCGFSVGDAARWRDCGFEAAAAMQFRVLFDDPEELVHWQRVGFSARDAARWRGRGFTVSDASLWRSFQMTAQQAYAWKQVGFDGHPLTADRLNRGGIGPQRWRAWRDHGVDTETLERYVLQRLDAVSSLRR